VALRREEIDNELRVRGRGRPRKSNPYQSLAPDDEALLASLLRVTILRDGYRLEPLPTRWYMPAADELLGDTLTVAWLDGYRARHRKEWARMRHNSVGYPSWTVKTARRLTARESKAARAFLRDRAMHRRRIMSIYSSVMEGEADIHQLEALLFGGPADISECVTSWRVTCATCHHEFLTSRDSRCCSLSCDSDYKTI
jgi:hypothetical protein